MPCTGYPNRHVQVFHLLLLYTTSLALSVVPTETETYFNSYDKELTTIVSLSLPQSKWVKAEVILGSIIQKFFKGSFKFFSMDNICNLLCVFPTPQWEPKATKELLGLIFISWIHFSYKFVFLSIFAFLPE